MSAKHIFQLPSRRASSTIRATRGLAIKFPVLRRAGGLGLLCLVAVSLTVCGSEPAPTPNPMSTAVIPAPLASARDVATPTPTPALPAATPIPAPPTATPTPTATFTQVPPTHTPRPSSTPTPESPTHTPAPTVTPTPVPSTPTSTPTPESPTHTPTPVPIIKLYWTDYLTGKIQRANLDGTEIEDLVAGLDAPEGIALDVSSGKMYWDELAQDPTREPGWIGGRGSGDTLGQAGGYSPGLVGWQDVLDPTEARA